MHNHSVFADTVLPMEQVGLIAGQGVPCVISPDAFYRVSGEIELHLRGSGMMDYSRLKMKQLRIAVREAGWTGCDMLEIHKAGLVEFLTTGRRPKILYELDGYKLTLSRRPETITELLELAAKLGGITGKSRATYQERSKTGRPSASLPTDMTPLLETIRNADCQGQPFFKSGRHGAYIRRSELPDEWQDIGRDRLERMIAELINTGEIVAGIGGKLAVPDNSFSDGKLLGKSGSDGNTCRLPLSFPTTL